MSRASDYVNRYIPDVSKRDKLYEEMADLDIPAIADDMISWDVDLASPLELTQREIRDIHEATNNPKLKRRKALQIWKSKINSRPGIWATYGMLLEKCLEGRDIKTAENICKLIQQGGTGGGGQYQPQGFQPHLPNAGQRLVGQSQPNTEQGFRGQSQPNAGQGQLQQNTGQGFKGQFQPNPGQGQLQQNTGHGLLQPNPGQGFRGQSLPKTGQYPPQYPANQGQHQQQGFSGLHEPGGRNTGQYPLQGPPPGSGQAPPSNTELKTLEAATSPLEIALTGAERELVHFLRLEGFISDSIRDKILNPVPVLSEEEKAGELVKWIKKRVKEDNMSYFTLVNELKQYGNRYRPIVSRLEAEYGTQQRSQGGLQTSYRGPQAGSAGPQASYPGPHASYTGPQGNYQPQASYPGTQAVYPGPSYQGPQAAAGYQGDQTGHQRGLGHQAPPGVPAGSHGTPQRPQTSYQGGPTSYEGIQTGSRGSPYNYQEFSQGSYQGAVGGGQPSNQQTPQTGASHDHSPAVTIGNARNVVSHGNAREGAQTDFISRLECSASLQDSGTTGNLQMPICLAPGPEYIPPESDGGRILQYEAEGRGRIAPRLKLFDDEGSIETSPKPVEYSHHGLGYYDMNSDFHGAAFIINNRTFDNKRHEERKGAERDEYNLKETFTYLGYRPVIFSNLTSNEINSLFGNLDVYLMNSDRTAKNKVAHDSFICCILSHGNEGVVLGSDSIPVNWKDAVRQTGRSEILKGKPKIFFIQTCQGKGAGDLISADGFFPDEHIYICLATVSGNKAYRDEIRGSLFCTQACQILCEYGKRDLFPHEFHALLERNMKRIIYESDGKLYVQKPEYSNDLKKCIHFF